MINCVSIILQNYHTDPSICKFYIFLANTSVTVIRKLAIYVFHVIDISKNNLNALLGT